MSGVETVTLPFVVSVENQAGDLLTVDDEAQAWDRYYVAAFAKADVNPGAAADKRPVQDALYYVARTADWMLEERRKRFPKKGSDQ